MKYFDFKSSFISENLQFKKDLMPYSSFIQVLDRLTVRSVLRGSTSTVLGILGTLAVFILCLTIYIPPTINYFKGNYFESEFWVRDLVNQNFYSNDDFKIAVQIRKKSDNSVANHTKIFNWAYSEFGQVYADWSQWLVQPSQTCYPNYLADTINPVYLQDCFMFPQHKLFDAFSGYGYYTDYTNIFYWLYPKPDIYPFTRSASGGNVGEMNKFFKDYYYIVYFTSQVTDPKSGEQKLQVNRYYSTDSDFSENVGSMIDLIVYNVKNYTLDISIMPWINNVSRSGLVWLGQTYQLYQLSIDSANVYGVQLDFSLYQYSVLSYRYYKKLDWLLGIIGGAMLLFYIILWVPCNFINKTIHQMNNVNQLLLINHAQEHEPITQDKVTAANVSNAYWFSNFITKKFFSSVQSADKLVIAGQRQLDIVRLIKKIKVSQRNLNKKKLLEPYEPKVLKLKTMKINQEQAEEESGVQDSNLSQEIVQHEMIVEEDLVELPTDPTFGITQTQMNILKEDQNMKKVYENNMTAAVIRGDDDHTNRLKQMQTKNKYGAIYSSKRKKSKARIVFNAFVELVRYCDFFGARPNLNAAPFGSSLVGFCGSFIIITLSILVCALTISNANVPQFMILDSYQDPNNFGYTMQTGSSLKFALCFSSKSSLTGTNKLANLRFFTNSSRRGFEYIMPIQLKASDYASFDLTARTSPINLNNCFGMEAGHDVLMGQNGSDFGYFGFKVEPYCSSTAAYCTANAATINNNLVSFINRTYIYLFLPQNRYDPFSQTFKNKLVYQTLNINVRYMKNYSAYEETLFVDQVRIEDDTKNWFMRKAPQIKSQGIAKNQHTSYPITKSIPGTPSYSVNIKPTGSQIRYLVSTKKADTILASIGGIFVLLYAVFHWIGKIYNTYNVKTRLAEEVYDQQCISDGPIIKLLTLSRLPICMIPTRFGMKYDVARARQVQKKMNNDLNYLWLVKYVDNIFNLSAALFQLPMASIQAKNLSLVFVKQKVDESEQVIPRNVSHQMRHNQQQFNQEIEIGGDLGEKATIPLKKRYNQILNQDSQIINQSNTHIQDSFADQKLRVTEQVLVQNEPQVEQRMQDNYLHGNPKQPRFNMFDTFEYPASLTFKGKREVTSFCGGCCCLIMTLLIVLVSAFELNIYLNKYDTRVGMSTEMMQPLSTQSNSTYNSKLIFETGRNFKLAVTFSSAYEDYPHNITNWTSTVGISIFQQTYTYSYGKKMTTTVEYPLISCDRNYLKPDDPLVDPDYYRNTEYGYCISDGINLQISGVPEDQVTKRFSLSIYNKAGTNDGNQVIKSFMQLFLPKIHFSSANIDFNSKKTTFEIHSLTFDAFNITYPSSQNITFSKVSVLFDDQIAFEVDPFVATTYVAMPFQQFQTSYNDLIDTKMSYNVSFANSYLVYNYRVVGNKFYQTFGIIGGLIALFIFGLGLFAKNFNEYRMQYLIGKELYLFDILKKKQAMAIARGRKRKTKQELQNLGNYNDMNEGQILLAYMLSFFAAIVSNYNINTTLRRVTLIQQRVMRDLNLFQIYKKIHNMRGTLNKYFSSASLPLANINLKHIYNPEPDSQSIVTPAKIVSFAKKHCWSSFQQYAIFDALKGRVNLKEVFDNAFLERAFNMQGLDRNSIHLSQFGGTQGSIGTTSVVESVAEGEQQQRQTFDIE